MSVMIRFDKSKDQIFTVTRSLAITNRSRRRAQHYVRDMAAHRVSGEAAIIFHRCPIFSFLSNLAGTL